mmetsp:Transcript_23751/g.48503  ORF Transcript_23751/g.48503 Transcript_23751/m.48503 type:complete len:120 (+) Transcript_23751:17-376(+)
MENETFLFQLHQKIGGACPRAVASIAQQQKGKIKNGSVGTFFTQRLMLPRSCFPPFWGGPPHQLHRAIIFLIFSLQWDFCLLQLHRSLPPAIALSLTPSAVSVGLPPWTRLIVAFCRAP